MGKGSALRTIFHRLVKDILDDDQKEELLEWISAQHSATKEVADRRGYSDLLQGFMDGYDIASFRIRESQKLISGERSEGEVFYFVCVRCNFPVAYAPGCACPICGKIDMLESI